MIPISRDIRGSGRHYSTAHVYASGAAGPHPGGGAPMITAPLPNAVPGQLPYTGLDPSDSTTWVRPYNPQPGMIAYLNFNGASMQGNTDMGGVWSQPADRNALVGARPRRRPR